MTFELRQWSEAYRDGFTKMQSDPEVMEDLGGPFAPIISSEKFDRYRDAWDVDGISRWAVVDPDDNFLGYAGVMKRSDPGHPLRSHYEIGWRFRRAVWGQGIATQSALRALQHAWKNPDIGEIVSYTAADNFRSQNVMSRLGLKRDAGRDFTAHYPRGDWSGVVWVAQRPADATGRQYRPLNHRLSRVR